MKIGIVTIGSLFWDQSDQRKDWRKFTLTGKKTAIQLPICYGRKSSSRNGEYTMVLSNSVPLGRCYLHHTKTQHSNPIENLEQLAVGLTYAETGSWAPLAGSWYAIGLLMRPDVHNTGLVKAWAEIFNREHHHEFNNELFKFNDDVEPVISENGFINLRKYDIQWNDLDAALIAVTKPELKRPTAKQIAEQLATIEIEGSYFDNCVNNCIWTDDDIDIIEEHMHIENEQIDKI